ncbi:hypothetical protein Tco_0659947 [Tanacetum coccineum]
MMLNLERSSKRSISNQNEQSEKSNDDWDHLLDFNLDDVPLLGEEGLPPFVCKMGKSSRNKKRAMENLNFFYQDIGTSSSAEEERPIIEIMAYHDKYKKILDEIWKDKVGLDGKIIKEEDEAVKRIKARERRYEKGVTTLIAKFLILDIPIDRDAPIVVGQGFLRMIGGIVNTPERLFLMFDGFCHQTFRAARSDVMRNAESDSDDEEEYQIQRNKFGAPIYGQKPAPYLNCNNLAERSLAIQTHVNWKPDYKGSYIKEEEATGQWRTKIRLTDPYGNIYLQGFTTKKTNQKLSKYHKLSDIMSSNWFMIDVGSVLGDASEEHKDDIQPSKKPKITITPPKQLFIDLTNEDTINQSPMLHESSPSAPNAPSKTPSTKDTSSSSIDYTPKSLTLSSSPFTNGYLNPPLSPPPRVPPPPPT